ncbi:MAG: DUF29 family protein [Phormidesmis sp.]
MASAIAKPKTLYDTDFSLWIETQGTALRDQQFEEI